MVFTGKGCAISLRVLHLCLCALIIDLTAHYLAAQTPESAPPVLYAIRSADAAEGAAPETAVIDYSLKIVFSDLRGAGLKEIALRIMDEKGAELLSVSPAGPVFLARLAPGVYDLELAFKGESKSIAGVRITDKVRKELYLYWD